MRLCKYCNAIWLTPTGSVTSGYSNVLWDESLAVWYERLQDASNGFNRLPNMTNSVGGLIKHVQYKSIL